MIYLIQVRYEDFTLAKIGYAKNIKRRMNSYITENPMATLINYREGSMEEEKLFHRAFSMDKFEKGLEWFYWKEDTEERFKTLDYSNERKKKLIEDINMERNYNKKLEIYKEIKEKYDKSYIDETLDKILGLIESVSDLSDNICEEMIIDPEDEQILRAFLQEFYSTGNFEIKMKMYCEFSDKFKNNLVIMDGVYHRIKDQRFLQYYRYYGTRGCSNRHFQNSELKKGWEDATKEDKLESIIYSTFSPGDKLAKSDIKQQLRDIYYSLSLSKNPKATDLGEYFKISKTQVTTSEGVKNGFKLGERLR